MPLKRPLRIASLAFAAWMGLLASPAGAGGADLNLLVVTVDTLRPDRLSCYSTEHLRTPRIDALAAKGVLFERAFAHDPETLPSHTNIFLGMTSLAHGVSENSKSIVAPDFETLAELLKSRGYATGAFVSGFPLDSRFGLNQGFDVYDDHYPAKAKPGEAFSERRADKTVAAALKWLAGQKGKWFCWVHLWDPHDPYAPPEPYATRFKDDPYSGEVAYVDAEIGRLMDALGQAGLEGRTAVVLTGDHGESLGDHGETYHGYFAYNATLWVPLIIAAPGTKAGRVKDHVSHVDIFPTVCDLLGLEKPASLQGASLSPLLRGRTRPARPIYFEALEAYINRGWAPLRGVIENGKKFISSPIPELYDLESDFAEGKDLAATSNLPAYQKRLQEVMKLGESSLAALSGRQTTDRETLERLRSLGYAASRVSQIKSSHGPEDDLKTLLPLEQKITEAARLKREGRLAQSVRVLEDVIKERKDFAKAYDQLFEIYRSQDLIDDALQVFKRGYDANPGNFVFSSGYGVALVKQGRYEEGAEVLEKIVEPLRSGRGGLELARRGLREPGRDGEGARGSRQGPGPGAGRRAFQRQSRHVLCQDGPDNEGCGAGPAVHPLFRKGHRRRPDPGLRLQRTGRRHADIGPSGRGHRQLGKGGRARPGLRHAGIQSRRGLSREREQGQGPRVLREIYRRQRQGYHPRRAAGDRLAHREVQGGVERRDADLFREGTPLCAGLPVGSLLMDRAARRHSPALAPMPGRKRRPICFSSPSTRCEPTG